MNKKILTYICVVSFLVNLSFEARSAEECFEGVSRAMFKFNMAFDDVLLEPVAKGYNKLPKFVREGTNNFTSNIATLLSIPNSILQGNLNQVGQSAGSFLINSSISPGFKSS